MNYKMQPQPVINLNSIDWIKSEYYWINLISHIVHRLRSHSYLIKGAKFVARQRVLSLTESFHMRLTLSHLAGSGSIDVCVCDVGCSVRAGLLMWRGLHHVACLLCVQDSWKEGGC